MNLAVTGAPDSHRITFYSRQRWRGDLDWPDVLFAGFRTYFVTSARVSEFG